MPSAGASAIVVLATLGGASLGGAIVIRGSPVRRARAVVARQSEQPLDEEELQALAGLWRASLDLDDGERELTCHLDVRPTDLNGPACRSNPQDPRMVLRLPSTPSPVVSLVGRSRAS
jgi:hypothetical protein